MAKLYFRYGAMNSGKSTSLLQAAFNYEERGHRVLLAKPRIDTKGGDLIVSRLGVTRHVDFTVGEDDDLRATFWRYARGADAPAAHTDAPAAHAPSPAAHADAPAEHALSPAAHTDAPAEHALSPAAHAAPTADEDALGLTSPAGHTLDITPPRDTHQPVSCLLIDEAQFLTPHHVDDLMRIATLDNIPVLAYGFRQDFRTLSFAGGQRLLEIAHTLEELKTICRCGRKAIFNARLVDGEVVFDGSQVAIDDGGAVTYESFCASCYLERSGGWLPHDSAVPESA